MLKKLNLFLGTVVIQLSKLMKISYIFGSHAAFFSAANISTPLVGVFFGIRTVLVYTFLRAIIDLFLFGSQPILYPLYHIASVFASAYWIYDSKLFRMGIPAFAILIFALHPAGSIFYAILWFIPIFASFYAEKSLFLKSLGATFTAHAFGSVVYLFTKPVIPWVAIIPVALLERLLFAVAIMFAYKAVMLLKSYNLPKIRLVYKRA